MQIDQGLEGPITERVQMLSILGSILLLVIIIQLIRKGYLKEGYSILWFLIAGTLIFLSSSSKIIFGLSSLLGIYYAPAALFLILLIGVVLISIHFSTIFTNQEKQIKKLSQEIALLKEKLEKTIKK